MLIMIKTKIWQNVKNPKVVPDQNLSENDHDPKVEKGIFMNIWGDGDFSIDFLNS
jgi:hypothetical protein